MFNDFDKLSAPEKGWMRTPFCRRWGCRISALILLFSFCPFCKSILAQARVGDEAGTLAAIARTETEAVLIVDSGVSRNGHLVSEPSRKFFDAGENASCALAGHLGYTADGSQKHLFDIAPTLTSWLEQHPKIPIAKAMPSLMRIAAQALAGEVRYRRNHHIEALLPGTGTDILCASFTDGEPLLLRARTTLDAKNNVAYEGGRPAEILIMEGAIPVTDLIGGSNRDLAFTSHFYSSRIEKLSLDRFRQAYRKRDSSKWDGADVRSVLFPLYDRVEDDTLKHTARGDGNIGVSAPNIIRIFKSDGRSSPKFSDLVW